MHAEVHSSTEQTVGTDADEVHHVCIQHSSLLLARPGHNLLTEDGVNRS